MKTISIEEFLAKSAYYPVLDVRSPSEFYQGHIPEAINFPLFSDEERAIIGTTYKKVGKQEAVFKGLAFVGKKMEGFVRGVLSLAIENIVLVHCWRGGMRSSSMAWLFETVGLQVYILEGGYKTYRTYIRELFSKATKITILSGMTGSGKTAILYQLAQLGEQVLDLEGIAHHKGSSFGALGEPEQPTNEQFENNLASIWQTFNFNNRIWIEDESMAIGTVRIPITLFEKMRTSKVILIQVPVNLRIEMLVSEYGKFSSEMLLQAIIRLRKRIGGENFKLASESLERNDLQAVTAIILEYYDKTYKFGIEKRTPETISKVNINTKNAAEAALLVLNFVKTDEDQELA